MSHGPKHPNRTRQVVEHLAKQTRAVTIAEMAHALGRTQHRITNSVSEANLRLFVRRTNKGEKFATYIITTAGRQALSDPDAFRDRRGGLRVSSVPPEPMTPTAIVDAALRSRPALAMVWGAA